MLDTVYNSANDSVNARTSDADSPMLSADVMLACRVAGEGIDGKTLLLIADAASDKAGVEQAAARLGMSVRFRMVDTDVLERELNAVHRLAIGYDSEDFGTLTLFEPSEPYTAQVRQHYVEALVARAVAGHASDIHIQPTGDALEIRLRLDGRLRTVERLPLRTAAPLVAQIKVLARLPLAEKRLPHDGRMSVPVDGGRTDLRVSILPSIHGEAVVLRLEGDEAPQSLDELRMPKAVRASIGTILNRHGGLLLIGGPTGSGKTTTLYAMLRALDDGSRKLLSVEDPVERILPGVLQVPVEPGGMGFGESIRAMLRHAPDAILVGEVRDGATAAAATEAALTGHFVLASAHARDAAEVAVRLADLGVSRNVLSCVLEAALTQRLARLLCPDCARKAPPRSPLARALGLDESDLALCREPVGCPACGGTGYRGRRAVFGLVVMRPELRHALSSGAGTHALRQLAIDLGMPTLADGARELVRLGLTDIAEALASSSLTESAELEQPPET